MELRAAGGVWTVPEVTDQVEPPDDSTEYWELSSCRLPVALPWT